MAKRYKKRHSDASSHHRRSNPLLAAFPIPDDVLAEEKMLIRRAPASTTRRRRPAAAATTADAADTTDTADAADDATTTAAAAAAAAAATTHTTAAAAAATAAAPATAAVPAVATTAAAAATTSRPRAATTAATTPSNVVAAASSSSPNNAASIGPASTSNSSTTSASSSSGGLSVGAIGGIAFAAVVGIFALSFAVWRYGKRSSSARRHRNGAGGISGAFGKAFRYQRHNDVGYPAGSRNGGNGSGVSEKDRDHQSFGNLAGMHDMGIDLPATEKGLSHAHTAGMTREEWLAHDGAPDAVPISHQQGGVDHSSAYYNQPGGHLSSYYGSDMNDYSMPPQHHANAPPPLPSKALEQHRQSQNMQNGVGGFYDPSMAGAAGGKPLSIVPEEEEERSQRFSASQAAGGLGQSQAGLANNALGSVAEQAAPAIVVGDAAAAEGTPFAGPPEHGKTFVVKRTFEPSMKDELVIFPGDRVQILTSYDDGWCLGVNLDVSPSDPTRLNRGVFPRDCVEELTGARGLHRVPTLPPLDLGHQQDASGDKVVLGIDTSMASGDAAHQPAPGTPAIEVFSPTGELEELDHTRALVDRFPASPNGQPGVGSASTSPVPSDTRLQRRMSSLIASRDAELFMALGEALDAKDAQRK